LKTEISILEYDGYLRTDAIEETRISKITIMRDKNSWIYHYLVPFLAHERKTFNKLFSTFDFSIFENT
ncbi:MAG: hypothetical protein RLZZ156_2896, partial [Deinococcota bacterium]